MKAKDIKIFTAVAMIAVFSLTAFLPVISAKADTMEIKSGVVTEKITPVLLEDAIEIEKMEPTYSMTDLTLVENKGYQEFRYLSFDVPEDSWVYMSGGFSLNNHDGASVHVDIYGNASYTRKVGEYGWGYWESDRNFYGFLKKGTYYLEMKAEQSNYDDYTGNIDLYVARIPVSKVFSITQKPAKDGKSVKVTLENRLAGYMYYVQYQKGKIGVSRINSRNTWTYTTAGFFVNSDEATLLKNRNDRYSFSVKKNGNYTMLVTDTNGSRYQKVVKVKGIRKNSRKK